MGTRGGSWCVPVQRGPARFQPARPLLGPVGLVAPFFSHALPGPKVLRLHFPFAPYFQPLWSRFPFPCTPSSSSPLLSDGLSGGSPVRLRWFCKTVRPPFGGSLGFVRSCVGWGGSAGSSVFLWDSCCCWFGSLRNLSQESCKVIYRATAILRSWNILQRMEFRDLFLDGCTQLEDTARNIFSRHGWPRDLRIDLS